VKRVARAAALGSYLLAASAPLLIAASPPRPGGRAFWTELGVAIGFVALGQTALQFGLIARFARLSRPFGIDLVMQFHRQMGVLALIGMIVHAVVLTAARPGTWSTLGVRGGSGALTGIAAVGCVLALVLLTLARKRMRLGYELWRGLHLGLSVLALACAQAHVMASGLYARAAWKAAALGAFSTACVGLIAYLRLVRPARLKRRPYVVAEVRPEGGSTWTLALVPSNHEGVRFAPGQFAWIKVGCSPWSIREHPFSFSSSAEEKGRIEFAVKEAGDFTRTIGSTAPGTIAYVDGPHGSFSTDFHECPAGYLFVAGGIGIAPILSMLRTLADRKDRRNHVLVHACTSLDRVSFRADLQALAAAIDLELVLVLTDPPSGWTGPSGYVSQDILRPFVAPGGNRRCAFVCGPDGMMSSVERSLLDCGMSPRDIHLERFNLA
jgi:predicted ferric reductase